MSEVAAINGEWQRANMELFPIDNEGRLFISPSIDDWRPIQALGIQVVIDLDDDLDIGVPEVPNQLLYIYYPIEDAPELPDLEKLLTIARMGAQLVNSGYKLLAHCGMGHNRSALVAGLILRYLGMSGDEVVSLLRERRQGALYNKAFADYVCCAEIRPMQLDLGAGI
jgi:protein-tyrosine phosphatase